MLLAVHLFNSLHNKQAHNIHWRENWFSHLWNVVIDNIDMMTKMNVDAFDPCTIAREKNARLKWLCSSFLVFRTIVLLWECWVVRSIDLTMTGYNMWIDENVEYFCNAINSSFVQKKQTTSRVEGSISRPQWAESEHHFFTSAAYLSRITVSHSSQLLPSRHIVVSHSTTCLALH